MKVICPKYSKSCRNLWKKLNFGIHPCFHYLPHEEYHLGSYGNSCDRVECGDCVSVKENKKYKN